MEAGGFLDSGFATRIKIQSHSSSWRALAELARVWQPPRLAGIQVDPDFGTPFLTASQVFDLPSIPRKWLSLVQTLHATRRFVIPGTILVTCSGTVGRTTLARNSLNDTLISHDILRVEPRDVSYWGWLFAYLRASSVIRMMQASHYGHMVKHLEPAHLNEVPVIEVGKTERQKFNVQAQGILNRRNRAEELISEANRLLSTALRLPISEPRSRTHNIARSTELSFGRRRMEGAFHTEHVRNLLKHLKLSSNRLQSVKDVVNRVWWMTRFRRTFGNSGVPYMSADDLFSISQITQKYVHTDPISNHEEFFVKRGWILMACSGQVYGLNGSVFLATKWDEAFFFSHDLIRITPRTAAIRPGYLFTYLGHPALGRVLLQRTAYGSSVPHIDPGDVEEIPVARLTDEEESEIANRAELAAQLNAEAAKLERELADQADSTVQKFLV